ncbi:MAG: SDR family NAD(P)-dependent oxidoreductase [Bacteriovoracia bacterium]
MILITGASSGIGEACARAFAADKRSLLLVARRKERLDRLGDELRQQHGIECASFGLDVRDRPALEAWAKTNASLLSRVTVLINSAGLARGREAIQDGKLEDWDEMIDTNVKALLHMTKLVLPFLLARQDGKGTPIGHIINLGSVAGRWAYPAGNVYAASKFAINGLSQGMRLDLLGTGVKVTEILPGMVETEFSNVRFRDDRKAKAAYAGMTPLTGADVAEAIRWAVNLPAHVQIHEIVLTSSDQASAANVFRRT